MTDWKTPVETPTKIPANIPANIPTKIPTKIPSKIPSKMPVIDVVQKPSFLHEQAPVHRLLPAPELRCPDRMPSDVSGPRQSAEVRTDHGRRAHAREAAAPRGSLTIVAGTAAGHAAPTESTGRLQT